MLVGAQSQPQMSRVSSTNTVVRGNTRNICGDRAEDVQPDAVSAALTSRTPAPTAVGSPAILRAERMRRALRVVLDWLSFEIMSASVPETTAADMLVPESRRYSPVQVVPHAT